MKKLLTLTGCLSLVVLFSFTFQGNRIQRINDKLYGVTPATSKRISTADQDYLKKTINEHYGIKDFSKTVVISANDPRNKMGGWILDNSVYKDFISTKFISWKNVKLNDEAIRLNKVLAKYAQ